MIKPEWACDKYGDWEHDWLDCPECLAGYEKYLESADADTEFELYYGDG